LSLAISHRLVAMHGLVVILESHLDPWRDWTRIATTCARRSNPYNGRGQWERSMANSGKELSTLSPRRDAREPYLENACALHSSFHPPSLGSTTPIRSFVSRRSQPTATESTSEMVKLKTILPMKEDKAAKSKKFLAFRQSAGSRRTRDRRGGASVGPGLAFGIECCRADILFQRAMTASVCAAAWQRAA
jgi:hypothetical protein